MKVFASVMCLALLAACGSGGTYYPEYEAPAPSSEATPTGLTVSGSARAGVVHSSGS